MELIKIKALDINKSSRLPIILSIKSSFFCSFGNFFWASFKALIGVEFLPLFLLHSFAPNSPLLLVAVSQLQSYTHFSSKQNNFTTTFWHRRRSNQSSFSFIHSTGIRLDLIRLAIELMAPDVWQRKNQINLLHFARVAIFGSRIGKKSGEKSQLSRRHRSVRVKSWKWPLI